MRSPNNVNDNDEEIIGFMIDIDLEEDDLILSLFDNYE